MTEQKQKHLAKMRKVFGSVSKFFKWLNHENHNQVAYSYTRRPTINLAIERLVDIVAVLQDLGLHNIVDKKKNK